MEGYIGFENYKDNKLRLEVGRVYTRRPVIGGKLSFFDNPLDVLRYYPPCDSGYSRVESPDNKADKQGRHVNTSELRVIEDVGVDDIAEAAEKIIREGINTYKSIVSEKNRSIAVNKKKSAEAMNSGQFSVSVSVRDKSAATSLNDKSVSVNTGNYSVTDSQGKYSVSVNTREGCVASSSGDKSLSACTGSSSIAKNTGTHSIAVSTGDESEAIVSGDQSVAISIGWRSKAKGALGCWLVLAECRSKKVTDVKSTQVDGDRIKANTFYRLKNGEFVECKVM